MDYIKVKGLSKSYSDIKALKNLSIEIEAGTLFGILGPNGAGKSTLIKILATLIEPDSGEVFINDINLIKNSRKIRELIGYVAQDIALDKILTGRELLDFQSDLYHFNKNKKFESNLSKLLDEWARFLESGILVRKGNRFFLSEPNGMELSNQVLVSMFKWWDEIY